MVPRLLEEGITDILEDRMARAWTSFAAYGVPDHSSLPEWKPCTADDDWTMVFDRQISVRKNFDREMLEYLDEYFPQPMIHGAVGTIHEDALSEEEQAERLAGMKAMLKDDPVD
jgi:hypothetical protein